VTVDSEQSVQNPFRDFRLTVEFQHIQSGLTLHVPGYFAADGMAAESGASSGTIWRAHLAPPLPGQWTYRATFRQGTDIAIILDPGAGDDAPMSGKSGTFLIENPVEAPLGFLGKNLLSASSETYLRHAGTSEVFLKFGANSPENFLGYSGFDQTPDGQHFYLPHVQDWRLGSPSWHGGVDGKGIIGALNYLANMGMNSVYLLTFNIGGDGDDVWPWTSKSERVRFDCSKLDQWEIVFDHMDRLGISAHLALQEQEIDNGPLALDGGALGLERMLYHRG
jgi:hypothetical protein